MITSIDQTALNLGVATLLGACIGFERQWRQRMAGLRTNTLVAIGAASFVAFESLFPALLLQSTGNGRLSLEPTVSAASWSVGPVLE